MDETYDLIVLGTGLTECVLSGLLSIKGKKVLHIDRNEYYGGENASLTLLQMYKRFRSGEPVPENMGRERDWAIDLVPKFLMAQGKLTNLLIQTDVIRYLEFKSIAGSYVYKDGKISKVPASDMEAVKSPLMGLFEKRRMKNFLSWLMAYDRNDQRTSKNINSQVDTMEKVYQTFGLERGTQDFVGHAMALYQDDDYKTKPAEITMERIKLYANSVARYGKSPYIYPLYGLGELPQSFARLSAVYGGTYMLNTPIDKVDSTQDGIRVFSNNESTSASIVIGDPSYFPDLVKPVGKVIRAICYMKNPIPNTQDAGSVQIIIPQNQIGRKHDIYIAALSSEHNVVPKPYYLGIVSTIVETNDPLAEIEPGLKLLGPILEKFVNVTQLMAPIDDGRESKIFISKSVDATSHFETIADDIIDLYERIMGEPLHVEENFLETGNK